MLDLQQDRLVALVREFVVDTARERAHARVVVLVLVDAGARRRRDLDEHELADPFGLELEKALDREEPLEYPLGIVESIHADAYYRVCGEAVPLAHVGAAFAQRFLHGLGVERPFYRDGIAPHRGLVAAVGYGVGLAIDPRLDVAVDRVDEIVAVELGVKSQNTAAENTVEDRLAPRADSERFGVGPGDVPEGDDGRLRQALPDHAGQQREVLVLDQGDGIGGRGFPPAPGGAAAAGRRCAGTAPPRATDAAGARA